MNDRFSILNRYMGHGNPHGDYWFIGIEEAEDFEEDIDSICEERSNVKYLPVKKDKIHENEKEYKKKGKSFTQIYNIMSKIIVGIEKEDWQSYTRNNLLQEHSNEFQMNLYPVGKPNIKNWDSIKSIFGFQKYEDYKDIVKETRLKRCMKNFWNSFNPKKITICFGWTYRDDFVEVLDLHSKSEACDADKNMLYYPDKRVFLTPFFGHGWMSDAKINTIRKKIEEINKP